MKIAKKRLPRKIKKLFKKEDKRCRLLIERVLKRNDDLIRAGYEKLEKDYLAGKTISSTGSIS